MSKIIGKVAATEKAPTTIDVFYFWTNKQRILNPFDVVKVEHIDNSITYGVIEAISHITDSSSYLSNFISSDFGDVEVEQYTNRIGMNYVKAKVVGNNSNIYTPVLDGSKVSLADSDEILQALGLDKVKNPMPCGYIEMYRDEDKKILPVNFNAQFLIGPEGAHLNISGISGLAAKTSYSMFLLRAIQEKYGSKQDAGNDNSVAFVVFNVKGRDLLAIDEHNKNLNEEDRKIYKEILGLDTQPFENVKYFYPYSDISSSKTKTFSYGDENDIEAQIDNNKAFKYKYIFEEDKNNLDLLFTNIEDSSGTMESIVNFIINGNGKFGDIDCWDTLKKTVSEYTQSGRKDSDKDISVMSWRKFKRIISKSLSHPIFQKAVIPEKNEVRLQDAVSNIKKNEVYVIDIAKLDQDTQAFVFGDVVRAIYDLKLGQNDNRDEKDIPSKVIIFIDELNKYASKDVPKNSPILRQILDIAERGRSLGIILFSVEQFKSAIHDRVKGNCSTHAYGRTNAIEISKSDYGFIPEVYKNMMTRLSPGEYILEHPVFRSLLNIRFPKPLYRQFPNG
ncbi:ATP-binding protein [Deferribacteraceae bacterium V6Fe1]|nr:ATP-binding protein [Deferribacteraceae bacterium V6Fe1]